MAGTPRDDIAYHRAKYSTRCMLCGQFIEAGQAIAKVASGLATTSPVKSKASWSHPDCLREALRTAADLSGRSAAIAYRLRRRRRADRTRRRGETGIDPKPVSAPSLTKGTSRSHW